MEEILKTLIELYEKLDEAEQLFSKRKLPKSFIVKIKKEKNKKKKLKTWFVENFHTVSVLIREKFLDEISYDVSRDKIYIQISKNPEIKEYLTQLYEEFFMISNPVL